MAFKRFVSTLTLIAFLLSGIFPERAFANPQGGTVTAGQANFSESGKRLDINQSSDKAVIDWRGFDIAPDEHTNFNQPNTKSFTLNRVNSKSPSTIAGKLTANGNIAIINQNGLMFDKSAVVDVNGLIATTADTDNNKFMSGEMNFNKPGNPNAKVTNAGKITAQQSGLVGLVAPTVENTGVISAKLGRVQLSSGDTMTVDLYGDRLLEVAVSDKVKSQLVSNSGRIEADGGKIALTAGAGKQIIRNLINVDGALQAQTFAQKNGEIVITSAGGNNKANINIAGTLDAKNTDPGKGGNITIAGAVFDHSGVMDVSGQEGGTVSVKAKNIGQQGKVIADGTMWSGGKVSFTYDGRYIDSNKSIVSTKSNNSLGGYIEVASNQKGSTAFLSGLYDSSSDKSIGGNIDIFGAGLTMYGTTLNANGYNGGGYIRVGGDFRGLGPMMKSDRVIINQYSKLSADADIIGQGGKIAIWSQKETRSAATLHARGGQISGDGGKIELSSLGQYSAGGDISAKAYHGQAGEFLIDPKNITIDSTGSVVSVDYFSFVDPNIDGNGKSNTYKYLTNGNLVFAKPDDNFGGTNAGAVYLFNGTTGAIITTLRGSSNNDAVGGSGVTVLGNDNFVVRSAAWNGTRGAATWGSATLGVSGTVSSSNSLVGSTVGDAVSSGGVSTFTGNNNYAVISAAWDSAKGAVTWGSGTTGVSGAVSSSNSLVGSTNTDAVGSGGITALTNGNYVVTSTAWDSSKGAVTWGSGTTGVTGAISSSNSLVGSTNGDLVGSQGITALSNGNYVVASPNWNTQRGAVTWGSGTTGISGTITTSNSLTGGVGTSDGVGNGGVIALTGNGNYVVRTAGASVGTGFGGLGAATWGDGSTGVVGVVSSTNSLVGSSSSDCVGGCGPFSNNAALYGNPGNIYALSNGNYVVTSPYFNSFRGAATWGSGTTGVTGTIAAGNSLLGGSAGDLVGNNLYPLTNGNYVVVSPNRSGNRGGMTWGNGTTGVVGALTSANSAVWGSANYYMGSGGVTELANGNFVLYSPKYLVSRGSVHWFSGTSATVGNMLGGTGIYGTANNDNVGSGGITTLPNGGFVVSSPAWSSGKGAITWGAGTSNATVPISSTNSLIGSANTDAVGNGGVTVLTGSSAFVVRSSSWNGNIGAVTWGSGTAALTGTVGAGNSLIGTNAGDAIGSGGITKLSNGNYVVNSPAWNSNTGAVTWVDGTAGLVATVGSGNSLVGSSTSDAVGSGGVTALVGNGNYVVSSPAWSSTKGAATWGSGTAGVSGAVSSTNSLVGVAAADAVSNGGITTLSNGNYLVKTRFFGGTGTGKTGYAAVTLGIGSTGISNVVNGTNSILSSQNFDGSAYATPVINFYTDENSGRVKIAFQMYDTTTAAAISPYETYSLSTSSATTASHTFSFRADADVSLSPVFITNVLNAGTSVTLQANNDITVNAAITANNSGGNGGTFTLQAGRSIIVNAAITTDNGNLNLYANEKAATGVVDANRLAGAAVITMGVGGSIDAGTGAVNIRLDNGSGNTNTTAGDITLRTITGDTIFVRNFNATGDIVLASGALTSAATGSALTLVSARNFTNSVGSGALVAGGTGRWLVYSTNPTDDTTGSLANGFRRFNCTYGGSCPSLGTGNGFLYSYQPTLTITPTAINITYGDAIPGLTGYAYSISGYLGTDSSADVVAGSLNGTTTYTQGANANNYNINYSTGSLTSDMGYAFSYANNNAGIVVARRTLSISANSGQSKIYGNADPTFAYTLTGGSLYNTDTLSGALTRAAGESVAGGPYAITQGTLTAGSNYTIAYTGANFAITPRTLSITATDKTMTYGAGNTYNGFSSTGLATGDAIDSVSFATNATTSTSGNWNFGTWTITPSAATGVAFASSNYNITYNAGALNVGKRTLNISATGVDKEYDRLTTAAVNLSDDRVGGDVFTTRTYGAANFTDKNVANGKTINVTGISITGGDTSNYNFNTTTSTTANITPKAITVSGVTANNKVYDQSTAASMNFGSGAFVGVIAGDTVTFDSSGASGSFANKNVGNGKAVTVVGIVGTGADSGNYTVTQPVGITANITPKTLTVSGVTASDKEYDRLTAANVDFGAGAFVGVIAGDTVVFDSSGASGTFANKNVGNGKAITIVGITGTGGDAGNYSITQPVGLTANITPKAITVSGVTANNKVYDRTTAASMNFGAGAFVGVIAGDTVTFDSSGASGTFADKNVGNGKAVTVSGIVGTGADSGNYTVTQPVGITANITPKALTVSGVTASNKVYDRTTAATLNFGSGAFVGVIAGDTVTFDSSGASGTFADKNVGNAKAITVVGIVTAGGDAGNYSVTQPTTVTANITPKALTVSGVTANDKEYDRTTAATLDYTSGALVGVIGGDTVTFDSSGASGTFANKNVGNGKAVTVVGITGAGADSGNYTVTQPVGLTANITPKALTVSGVTASDKVYDRTTAATLNFGSGAFVGVIAGDTVTFDSSGASGTFADKNVANGKAVTVVGIAGTGADSGNYTVAQPVGITANITAKALTVTGVTANNKVYDRTTAATLNFGSGAFVGVIAGDTVTFDSSGASGAFVDKNVANGKSITVSGITTGGADAGNYSVTQPTAVTANITPKAITVSGVTANNKVYDRTTAATLDYSSGAFAGVIAGDTVTFDGTGASGAFADKNVGNGKAITVVGIAGTGADSGNYTVTQPTTITANITPKAITVSGVTANNKVYDRTTAATLNYGSAAFVGVIAGDTVTFDSSGASGTFANKNVGNGKSITVAGIASAGADGGNYTVTQPLGVTANITPKALTISGVTANNKVYDRTTAATMDFGSASFVGVIGGDTVTFDTSGATGAFVDKNVGNGKTITVAGIALGGGDGGNYTVAQPAGLTANITPKALTISATGINKVYDGTTNGTVTLSDDRIAGDSFTVQSYASALFTNKNVANGKTVNVSGISISGGDAGNYSFNTTASTTANITPRALNISATAANKIYDQTDAATITFGDDRVAGDVFSSMVYGSALFSDKNVGNGKTVTVSGINVTGGDIGNYTFNNSTTTTANITPKDINVLGIIAQNKIYNGTVGADISFGSATFDGVYAGDTVTLNYGSAVGVFSNKNAGNNKNVIVTGIGIAGADAGNYTIAQPTDVRANIFKRALNLLAVGQNKVYDGTTNASVAFTDDRLAGDDFQSTFTNATFADKNVGIGKLININGVAITGVDAGNYEINTASTNASANITKASVVIKANNATRKKGVANPIFTARYSGFVAGEDESVISNLSIGTTADEASAVGQYDIIASGAQAMNYDFTYENGALTITAAGGGGGGSGNGGDIPNTVIFVSQDPHSNNGQIQLASVGSSNTSPAIASDSGNNVDSKQNSDEPTWMNRCRNVSKSQKILEDITGSFLVCP